MSGYVGSTIRYAVVPVIDGRMTSTGLHVGTVVGGVELAPSGPDRPGDRLGPTSGGAIGSQGWRVPGMLRSSTCSTQRYASMVWRIVLYLTRPPQDLTDLDTIWDLLQEGP